MSGKIIYQQINKDHAYWPEKLDGNQTKGGHTAGLLTHFGENGKVKTNILFDAGLGTITGLCELDEFEWEWPLTSFITHGHPDHHLELMILSELWCKRLTEEKRESLKVHCTQETFDKWLESVHGYGFGKGNTLELLPIEAGHSHKCGIFKIHAIKANHCPGSVIYVVTFGQHKIVIGWDIGELPDPDKNNLLKNPSLALLEANTWKSLLKKTGHTSVEDLVETGFIEKLKVSINSENQHYGVFLVHYGGGEDTQRLSDIQLKTEFDKIYPEKSDFVKVAKKGQKWCFTL